MSLCRLLLILIVAVSFDEIFARNTAIVKRQANPERRNRVVIYDKKTEYYYLDGRLPQTVYRPQEFYNYYMYPAIVGESVYVSLCPCRGVGNTERLAIHNRDTNQWSYTPYLRYPRQYHQSASVGDVIYVFGGENENVRLGVQKVEAYDVTTAPNGQWELKAEMPYDVQFPGVAVVGTKIYVCGGFSVDLDDTIARSLVYDTVADTWTDIDKMRVKRERMSAAAIGTKVYVCGGLAYTSLGYKPIDSCEIYDTLTDTWSDMGVKLNIARYGHQLVAAGGKLYAFGGYGPSYFKITSSVEVYDPYYETWSEMPNNMLDEKAYFGVIFDED